MTDRLISFHETLIIVFAYKIICENVINNICLNYIF